MGKKIIGIDEVGRGCLAGPVFATALYFKPTAPIAQIVRDSKVLSKKRRDALAPLIKEQACFYTGVASVEEIDELNIRVATHLAMFRAFTGLALKKDYEIIIDGHEVPTQFLNLNARCLIKADTTIPEVSAASIVAKVERDTLMEALALKYPVYGWERNAGYGTLEHRKACMENGQTVWHRKTFKFSV